MLPCIFLFRLQEKSFVPCYVMSRGWNHPPWICWRHHHHCFRIHHYFLPWFPWSLLVGATCFSASKISAIEACIWMPLIWMTLVPPLLVRPLSFELLLFTLEGWLRRRSWMLEWEERLVYTKKINHSSPSKFSISYFLRQTVCCHLEKPNYYTNNDTTK